MRCPICEATDKWKNVDEFRIKPEGMSLCMGCGFVSYPELYKSKEEIIKYYEDDYRTIPKVTNLFQGERKIHYHAHFLEEIIAEWKKNPPKDMNITDIGSAFGQFLNWLRGHFKESSVVGVELTKGYVRNAWHLFGIETLKDFDDTKKYDLISSYKSLEHILDPDIELKRYIDALKDDGYLYLGVPCWFDELGNFGSSGIFDIEYYYSTNHINTWTRKQVEGLIKVCGGEVIKENHTYYDSVYLIKKSKEAPESREICKEDPEYILECLDKVKKVSDLITKTQFKEAIEIWPNCPSAHLYNYEHNRKGYHKLGFDYLKKEVLDKMIEDCPNSGDVLYHVADIYARYDKWDVAVEYLDKANSLKPNSPHVFTLLSNCFRQMAEHSATEDDRIKFYEKARETGNILKSISMQAHNEAVNWIMFDNSKLPTPFERIQTDDSDKR